MATPTLTVSISTDKDYSPFFGGSDYSLSLSFKVDTWKEVVETGGFVIPTSGITGTAISINTISLNIELKGSIYDSHPDHPISAGHNPDLQDLEEFALMINRGGLKNIAVLTLRIVDTDRKYHGVLKKVVLLEQGGQSEASFVITFQALWTVSKPPWRGWA